MYNVFSRLICLLECNLVSGICDFVIMIGLLRFLSMNDSVEVVYVIVLVLCRMIKLL